MLLCIASAMATGPTPRTDIGGANSTLNATVTLFSVYWNTTSPINLSSYIFQSDNSGTNQNLSTIFWAGGQNASWSYNTITTNATEQTMFNWKVYANDSSNNWRVYTGSYYMTHKINIAIAGGTCPTNTLPNTFMYIFVILLVVGFGIWASYSTILFFSIVVGFVGIIVSFPMYACNPVYGLLITLASIFYIIYEAFLRKFTE